MSRLAGKVAVITGGNSGIGLATAYEFLAQGANVVISGRNAETLRQAIDGRENIIAVQGDVLELGSLSRLFEQTNEQFGKIDILVVNAGIFKGAPLAQTEETLYDEIMDINVKGAFFTVQKAVPYLNAGATVVLVSSTVNEMGLPDSSVYAASKAALRSLGRTLGNELIQQGIRVNVFSPGPINTPIYDRLGMPAEALQEFATGILNQVPMRRFGSAEEIAKGILFLASDDSSFMLGAEIVADGGFGQV
jgi:NAD(P)-dependent dehydrogenase (short-subunit alcohol dehydrogenase family)